MSVFIFTDCYDANAVSRQIRRWQRLFRDVVINCFSVEKSIEASFCVLDTYLAGLLPISPDQNTNLPDILVGNIAPREERKYPNGAPFCFAYATDGTLIIGTPDTFVLPLREGLIQKVFETDAFHVCKAAGLSEDQALKIANSQFRSLDYVPLLAYWLLVEKKDIPVTQARIDPKKFDNEIGYIDCFGNCKSTVRKSDFPTTALSELINTTIELSTQPFSPDMTFYKRLADVPNDEDGVTEGSSGNGFLEIVRQGGSAQNVWSIAVEEPAFTIPVFEEV